MHNLGFCLRLFQKSPSPKTTPKNSQILHTYSSWVCVIKVCSDLCSKYFIGEIIAKENSNIANLMEIFENFLLQNYSTEFCSLCIYVIKV